MIMRKYTYALVAFVVLTVGPVAVAQVPPTPPTPATPRVPRPPKPPHGEGWARGQQGRFEETDRKTLTVSRAVELDLSNISGDITVTPGGGRDATIEYTRRGFGDTQEEAKRQLEMIDVSMTVNAEGRAEIRSRFKVPPGQRQKNFRSAVDFRVTTPAETRIRVHSVSGDVTVTKMKGDLQLESVSGDIRIDAGGRVSAAKSISGDVEISGAIADDSLAASSVSGTVLLRSLKARYVDVNAVSGDIVMKDVTCERAEAQTISGSVEYAGPISSSGRYELKSHSGDVRLVVTGGSGFDVEANSFSGKIRSDLPIKNLAEEEEPVVVAGRRVHMPNRATFRGTFKDGSASIELTTFSGNIVITK
jgi:DUF4097 and DUF4098 domain-containing protein YvlB